MKITRYPQSCVLLEKEGNQILVDPGDMFAEKYKLVELGSIAAVIYTHPHSDHFDEGFAMQLRAAKVPMYGNEAVAELAGEGFTVVSEGSGLTLGGFKVMPHKIDHCLLPDGAAGPENTGYMIDDMLFIPGDSAHAEGLEVANLMLPITGPDISMHDAYAFALATKAKQVIPYHYDKLGANPDVYAAFYARYNPPFTVTVLGDGESAEL